MIADYRQRLIDARTALGLTERQMAERLLTPWQTYQQWERGSRRTPGLAVVAAELLVATGQQRKISARHEQIKALLLQGLKLREIADQVGVTKQYIGRLARKWNIRSVRSFDFRNAAAAATIRAANRRKEKRSAAIAEFRQLVEVEGLSIREAASRMEVPRGRAEGWVKAHNIRSTHKSCHPDHQTRT